jgi:transcriptional regulator with XRE-family HTH domain
MTKIKDRLKKLVSAASASHTYKLERAILKFTEQLSVRMKALGISSTELAGKIGAKPPYVSKILRGNSNFTLDSLIKISSAVQAEFEFNLVPKEEIRNWTDTFYTIKVPLAQTIPLNRFGGGLNHYENVGSTEQLIQTVVCHGSRS